MPSFGSLTSGVTDKLKQAGSSIENFASKFKTKSVADQFKGTLTPEQQIAKTKAVKAQKRQLRQARGARVMAVKAANSGGSVVNRIAPLSGSFSSGVQSRTPGRRT